MSLFDWLKEPDARAIEDLDGDETVFAHARSIKSKGFLRRLYSEYYDQMGAAVGYGEHGICLQRVGNYDTISKGIPNRPKQGAETIATFAPTASRNSDVDEVLLP